MFMSRVGLEPTSANTDGLKPSPLDRSGTVTGKKIQKFKNYIIQ